MKLLKIKSVRLPKILESGFATLVKVGETEMLFLPLSIASGLELRSILQFIKVKIWIMCFRFLKGSDYDATPRVEVGNYSFLTSFFLIDIDVCCLHSSNLYTKNNRECSKITGSSGVPSHVET